MHEALSAVRAVQTYGMMEEGLGMASSIFKKYAVLPREVFTNHFPNL